MSQPEPVELQPMIVKRRLPGIPLATVLLAVGACGVLAVLLKPPESMSSPSASGPMPDEALIGAVVIGGGVLGVIVSLYSSAPWRVVVLSYFAATAASAVALHLLVEPHDVRVTLAGSGLLLAYGAMVRVANRKLPVDSTN